MHGKKTKKTGASLPLGPTRPWRPVAAVVRSRRASPFRQCIFRRVPWQMEQILGSSIPWAPCPAACTGQPCDDQTRCARPRVVTLFFWPFFVWRQRLRGIVCLVLFSLCVPARPLSLPQNIGPKKKTLFVYYRIRPTLLFLGIVRLHHGNLLGFCASRSHDPVTPYVGSLALAGGGSPNHRPERDETGISKDVCGPGQAGPRRIFVSLSGV